MSFSTAFGDFSFPQLAGVSQDLPHFPPVPPGYDTVVQCSNRLLNQALNFNLASVGLNILSARVPYDPSQVSPGLRALVASHAYHPELLAGIDLEVVLLSPWVSNLDIPPSPQSGVSTVGTLAGRSSHARTGGIRQSTGDLMWVLQVNLFQATPLVQSAPGSASTPGSGAPAGSGPGRIGVPPIDVSVVGATMGPAGGGGLPDGTRTVLAQGTARMRGNLSVGTVPESLQFWSQLDCSPYEPTYQSTDAALTEFLATDLAGSMLAQAVAPLRSGFYAHITPTITVAGDLRLSQIASLQLQPPTVNLQLGNDAKGQVLTLSAVFGQPMGTPSVGPFLNGSDFACYVAERVYSRVLPQRWTAKAIHVPIISFVPIQMQVSQDSQQMGQGLAQVQVTISDQLQQARLVPSDIHFSDPMQLVSQETVQVLHLWDPGGNEVNLGKLGDPSTKPLVINLQLFDKLPAGAQQNVQQQVASFVAALLGPIYKPIAEKLRAANISGFTSAPLRAVVVTWNVPRAIDPVAVTTTVGAALNA